MLAALLDILLPRRCGVCGDKLLTGEMCLCADCVEGMPLTYFWDQPKNAMADKLNARIEALRVAGADFSRETYAYAVALYFYKGPYKEISKSLKYNTDLKLGRHVAALLGERVAASEMLRDVDMVVPVPLHRLRRLRRGYNQSEVIAREVARTAAVPCVTDLLVRVKRTRTQTRLSISEKATNVAGAFRVDKKNVIPRHVLLIDDVFTTGSTLAECHRALRQAFPLARISVATLAFVGD